LRAGPTSKAAIAVSRPELLAGLDVCVLFPLILLTVRRWGAAVMIATVTLVAAAIGIAGGHISRVETFVIQSPPDLAALFALGTLTAGIVCASRAPRSWPWAWLALGAAAPVLATCWRGGSAWTLDHLFWVDLALGAAIACLPADLDTGRPARLLRLLDAWPIRNLGLSSYRLYLTHAPIDHPPACPVRPRMPRAHGAPG
jgi:peptidoglycan/LPS O-acetylase OafA/YrhL